MHFFTGLPNKTISPIRQLELIQIAAAWILHNTWKTEYISSSHNHITSSNSRILAVVFSSIHNGFEGRAYSQGSGPKIYCVVQAGQASLVCTHRSGGGGGVPKVKTEHCETTFSSSVSTAFSWWVLCCSHLFYYINFKAAWTFLQLFFI